MTREEAKDLLPIITAYAEGKQLEYFSKNCIWEDCNAPAFYENVKYRIKPEKEYRPFSSVEECWEELKKHKPFGWIKDIESGYYILISVLSEDDITISRHSGWDFKGLMRCYTFADGKPFGIERL